MIYNSEILSISDERSVFEAVRPSVVRLAFTDENAKQMADVLSKYFATRQPGGFSSDRIIDRYTRGHIKRGVD